MKHVEGRCGRVIFARLFKGEDLIKSIKEAAEERNITAGAFFAIGTLSQVVLYYYHPKPHPITLKKPLEIVACSGSISKEGNETIVHAHIDVTDSEFKSQGGHLGEGSLVDARAFLVVFELEGADPSKIEL